MKEHCANRKLARVFASAACAMGICLLQASQARPDLVSSLYVREYALIPEPQQVKLGPDDFWISGEWWLERGPGVEAGSPEEDTLQAGLDVGGGSRILYEDIPGRKLAVPDLVYLIVPDGTERRQNDGVANPLLFDHLLQPGKQMRVVLESEHDDALEVSSERNPVGDLIAVGPDVLGGISG